MTKRKLSDPEYAEPPAKLRGNMTSSSISEPGAKCQFLELAAELRLMIYQHLLVSEDALQGKRLRKKKPSGIYPAILRTNRQIYKEARPVFFAKNTFTISSIPQPETEGEIDSTKLNFEPPLERECWPELRHLTIDLMYYPAIRRDPFRELPDEEAEMRELEQDGVPTDPGCSNYIQNLTALLEACNSHLRTFNLVANINDTFSARRSSVGFFTCDKNRAFGRALAAVNIPKIPVQFDFTDSFYHVDVPPPLFANRSILVLACHVMLRHSSLKVERLSNSFTNGAPEAPLTVTGRTDLTPFIRANW